MRRITWISNFGVGDFNDGNWKVTGDETEENG